MAYTKVGYSDSNGSWNVLKVNSDGSIDVSTVIGSVLLETTDIQIGAVEIKDDDTGSRLDILSAGTPSNYSGVEVVNALPTGVNEIGSVVVSSVQSAVELSGGTATIGSVAVNSGTIDTVSAVTSLTAGSVQLQPGTDVVGSVHVTGVDGGTVDTVSTVTSLAAGSVQLQPASSGSVYINEEENEAAAAWLSGLSNVLDYGIASNTSGSVIILARTL